MERFAKTYEFVGEMEDLKTAEKKVYSYIYSWPEGCWESNGNIGKITYLHPRTVQKAVRALRDKKYIDYKPRGKNGRILTINVKKAAEVEIPLFAQEWARQAAAKALVKNLARKLSGTACGHRGIGRKAWRHRPEGTQ